MNISSVTFLLLAVLGFCGGTQSSNSSCPCENPDWCKPISRPTVADNEIFVFSCLSPDQKNVNYKFYDWNKVTTISVGYNAQRDSDMLCYAHSQGVRVVQTAGCSVATLKNTTAYREWISKQVENVVTNHLDGINMDFESPLSAEDAPYLNKVTQELKDALKARNKNFQISFDFAWSPDCIDDRCYDFKTLADIVDVTFVMSYDERNHDERHGFQSPCIAWANSAANTTTHGVVKFLKLGIPPTKMILGVPWYGYIYHCTSLNSDNVCELEPSRDTGCKLGSQVSYKGIMEEFYPNSTSGRLWDRRAATPYFTLKDPKTGGYQQVWYDGPASLGIKYDIAKDLNMRGVGMWCVDQLDYSDTPYAVAQRRQMWGAMPKYKKTATVEKMLQSKINTAD